MRKMSILVLALMLVMGMSFGVMAQVIEFDSDSTTATLLVAPYATIEFFTNENYGGLYPDVLAGMKGLYVSDGNATKNAVSEIWDDGDGVSGLLMANQTGYNAEGNNHYVAPFVVDMNTPVNIDMEVDWSNWAKVPTAFRISSDESLSFGGLGGNGMGSWGTSLAMVTNVTELEAEEVGLLNFTQSGYLENKTMGMFNNFGDGGAFICEGPFEFHLNSAVYLPKVGSLLAGKPYTAEITMTVSSAYETEPQ